jgi:2-oxoglutarate dehydrogenase E2 component (dihydrolipoamide succinyltransferase)
VGDTVVRDEPLFEISTDKVDSEIPSPASGILSQILVPEGKTVQINTVLAIINVEAAEERGPAIANSREAGVHEIQEETSIPKTETPPVAAEPGIPEEAPVRPAAPARPSEPAGRGELAPVSRAQDIRTSPLVRRLSRENDVDLAEIRGTGIEGRITKDDVLNYLAQRTSAEHEPSLPRVEPVQKLTQQEANSQLSVAEPAQPHVREGEYPQVAGENETVPMIPMRKVIAEHMVLSKKTSAHVHTVFEIDMSPIVKLREIHRAEFEKKEGLPLTYTPFFAKALVDNVREFPVFNSSISGDSIVYKKSVNLGIAVALDTGLIVPVIKDAHLKSFTGIALAIHDLAERARTKKLKPDEVQGGTISMTNPGSFGALFGTPIISQPQVAILGVGGIEKRPVIIQDAIAIRSMVYLSLGFDHRLIDGAVADRFMARLKERMQSWTQWID